MSNGYVGVHCILPSTYVYLILFIIKVFFFFLRFPCESDAFTWLEATGVIFQVLVTLSKCLLKLFLPFQLEEE